MIIIMLYYNVDNVDNARTDNSTPTNYIPNTKLPRRTATV